MPQSNTKLMIKEVRTFYGLSQEILAGYLGITRSQLSMAEISKRSLTTSALLRLNHLFLAITENAKKMPEIIPGKIITEQNKQLEKFVSYRISENEYKLIVLSRSLKRKKPDQMRSFQLIESIQALKEDPSLKDNGIINIIDMGSQQLQKKSGAVAMLKLELQIKQLETETAFLKNLNKE